MPQNLCFNSANCEHLLSQVGRQKARKNNADPWFFVNPESPELYSPLIVSSEVQAVRNSYHSGSVDNGELNSSVPENRLRR